MVLWTACRKKTGNKQCHRCGLKIIHILSQPKITEGLRNLQYKSRVPGFRVKNICKAGGSLWLALCQDRLSLMILMGFANGNRVAGLRFSVSGRHIFKAIGGGHTPHKLMMPTPNTMPRQTPRLPLNALAVHVIVMRMIRISKVKITLRDCWSTGLEISWVAHAFACQLIPQGAFFSWR